MKNDPAQNRQNSPMPQPIAILDGQIVATDAATIAVGNAGFVHAAAVAEMIRTFRQQPFRLDDHLDRLQRGIHELDIAEPPTRQRLQDAVEQIVSANSRFIPTHHDLGAVVFVTAGMNPTYLGAAGLADAPKCTWGVHSFPLPFEFWAESMRSGQRLLVPGRKAIPPECLDPTIKWRSRVHWYLMDRAVKKIDRRAVAIPIDANGFLTETSAANLFVVKNGRIRTPRAENTLDGVSRRVALELAAECGVGWEWADITPAELAAADEAFTSSTPYCLMPVRALGDQSIGDSGERPVYDRLMSAWNDLAGVDIIEQLQTAAAERGLKPPN